MRQSDSSPRYRSTALDRALAPARTVVVVGPVAGLDEAAMRAVLLAAQKSSSTARVALSPRLDSPIWDYSTDLDEAVEIRDDLDNSDLADLVTEIRSQNQSRAVQVTICGEYVVVNYSHGIADGQLGVTLPALLTTGDTARAELVVPSLEPKAVWTALRRHYVANPTAVKDFWRLRREHKTTAEGSSERRIRNWHASTRSFSAYLPPADLSRLRTWAKEKWPGATAASINVSLWLAALQAEGLSVDDRVMILMNCRRYLAPECASAHGNFAVGIPLRLPGRPSPDVVAGITRSVIESGWPIAILGMAEIKERLRRGTPPAGEPADGVAVGNRIRAAVSDVGRLRMYEPHPWAPGDRPPQLVAYLEPDGPDAVPLLVAELAGGQTFTASFCTQMVDASVIERAVRRMCTDPIGLLEARGVDV